jgi:molecular chaperone DnaK
VERLVKEAEGHASEDRARREEVELRNQADQMIDQADKVLAEHADRVPSALRAEVEAKKAALGVAKAGDVSALRRAMDEFNETLQKVGQAVYQEAGAGGSQRQREGGGQDGQDDVVDAEYREVP